MTPSLESSVLFMGVILAACCNAISSFECYVPQSSKSATSFRSRTATGLGKFGTIAAAAPSSSSPPPSPSSATVSLFLSSKKDAFNGVHFSDSPIMDKIDMLERDLKHSQDEAHAMLEILQKDVAMQRMFRSESQHAMERLKLVKTDMVKQLNEMKNHYEDEKKQLLKDKERYMAEKDEVISEYEKELTSLRRLSRRFAQVLVSRVKQVVGRRSSERRA